MKFMYFFDDKIKRHIMKGKKYCNPAETGNYECGISCIRQGDVNLWFYTKNGVTIAVDSGHLNYRGVENSFQQIGINPEEIKHVFIDNATNEGIEYILYKEDRRYVLPIPRKVLERNTSLVQNQY